jgi:hypothetical protein
MASFTAGSVHAPTYRLAAMFLRLKATASCWCIFTRSTVCSACSICAASSLSFCGTRQKTAFLPRVTVLASGFCLLFKEAQNGFCLRDQSAHIEENQCHAKLKQLTRGVRRESPRTGSAKTGNDLAEPRLGVKPDSSESARCSRRQGGKAKPHPLETLEQRLSSARGTVRVVFYFNSHASGSLKASVVMVCPNTGGMIDRGSSLSSATSPFATRCSVPAASTSSIV